MLLLHNQLKALDKKTHTEIKKMCEFWGPFWGPFLDPEMGLRLAAVLRILVKPEFEAHFWDLFWDPKLGPKIDQKRKKASQQLGKLRPGGVQGFRKVTCRSQPKHLEPIASLIACFPPSTDHLQRALATSTGCVYVMRHALHMI